MATTANGFEIVKATEIKEILDLKKKTIYYNTFLDLSDSRQRDFYTFCKCHASLEICRETLRKIQYAITQEHFGW